MSPIRIKLDLPFEYAVRIAVVLANDAHECEKVARFYDKNKKPEYSKFYRSLADETNMIKDALDLQINDAKNIYIEG